MLAKTDKIYPRQPLLVLAPMAGITDFAFRSVCKNYGADVVYSEMVSAAGIHYHRHEPLEKNKSLQLLRTSQQENPLIVQLFGNDPDHFAAASSIINHLPKAKKDAASYKLGFFQPAGIDINFGCPVPKVIRQGSGCRLMADPVLSGKIIQAVAKNCSLPISIKIRAGIKEHSALDFLQALAGQPWKTVMVHARTFTQGFTGPIDTVLIKKIKELYPDRKVIANGGVFTPEDAVNILDQTQADGIAIARGALGRPWLFQQIKDFIGTGSYFEPTWPEVKKTILQHSKLVADCFPPTYFPEFRKHLGWYFKGYNNSKELRQKLFATNNQAEVKKILSSVSFNRS